MASGDSREVTREPWRRDGREVAAELGTDVDTGLSSTSAASRLERCGPNELEAAEKVPGWRKLLSQFADPLIYLLIGAVVVSLAAWIAEGGDSVPWDPVVIGVIVVANGVLGYVQEARAEEAVEALQRMTVASATVVRDGREQRIASTEVVPGDVLVLGEGDAVSADGRLVRSASLQAAEASLTGESEAVLKDSETIDGEVALGDRLNMVFSGTAVTRGRGRVVVTSTGMATGLFRRALR